MRLAHGFDIHLGEGWQAVAHRQAPEFPGHARNLVVHAATVPLGSDDGTFGSGVAARLGRDDLFCSFMEYDAASVGTALFSAKGLPTPRPSDFMVGALQRSLPGQSGAQWFFTEAGRPWCLFVILGGHSRRQSGAVRVGALLKGVRIV